MVARDERKEYELYIEQRTLLTNLQLDASKVFDRTLTALSAGALVLSVTFIGEIAPHPVTGSTYYIILSWISFGVALIAILIALYCSQKGSKAHIKELDRKYKENEWKEFESQWYKCTNIFNIVSIIAFINGIALFIVFSYINLPVIDTPTN